MKSPPIRPAPRSSRSWPPLELELRGSRRLAAAWVLWCLALAVAMALGCALPGWIRLGVSTLVLGALRRGALTLRAGGGRLRWQADGRWRHQEPGMSGTYVQPTPPQRLGPMLWLSWPGPGGRRYFPLEVSGVEPKARRTLKARMKFSGSVGSSRAP